MIELEPLVFKCKSSLKYVSHHNIYIYVDINFLDKKIDGLHMKILPLIRTQTWTPVQQKQRLQGLRRKRGWLREQPPTSWPQTSRAPWSAGIWTTLVR